MSDKLGITIDWGGNRNSVWRQLVWYATRNSYYNTTAELKIAREIFHGRTEIRSDRT